VALEQLIDAQFPLDQDDVMRSAKLLAEFDDVDEYRALARFVERFPEAMSASELAILRHRFRRFALDYADIDSYESGDAFRNAAEDLNFIASRMGENVQDLLERLEDQADAADERSAELQGGAGARGAGIGQEVGVDDVPLMFVSLESELVES